MLLLLLIVFSASAAASSASLKFRVWLNKIAVRVAVNDNN